MLNILFITSHNPATNPRVVKEIRLALDEGHNVSVICFEFNNWSRPMNDAIVRELNKVKWVVLPAERKPIVPWLRSVIAEKACRLLLRCGLQSPFILAQAVSRRNILLLKSLNKVARPDLVIGHNPGALYACLKAAKLFKCKAGFDVEDYHPGEGKNIFLQQIIRQLMQEVLPAMNYVSFAAPLIRVAVKNDLGREGNNWMTVLNYFHAAEFVAPAFIKGPLKLVWFSQHISAGRGLEYVLPVLHKFATEIELHLLGKLDPVFFESYIKHLSNVIVHYPLPQNELHNSLSSYDVGLALEPEKDINNNLAISNKLLAYLQAGLLVLASATTAQHDYLNDIKFGACIIDILKKNEIEQTFLKLIERKEQIRKDKLDRFVYFDNNWELESEKLLKEWNKLKC